MSASRCLGARLEWRPGGINATIAIPDHERFSGQHRAAEEESFSRAVEFDVTGDEARKVWEFRPEPANWSRAVAASSGSVCAGSIPPPISASGTAADTIVVSEMGARLWPNAAPR